jgi:O-antigen/teichoic acid export membrane protein
LKNFFSNQPLLKKIFKHSSVLFSGQIIFTLLGIGSLAITARILGAEKLGILTLIQTSVFIISAVLLPKPWLTIVRFGATLEYNKRFHEFKSLITLSFIVEIFFAVIAGLITILLRRFILEIISVNQDYSDLFMFYTLTLFLNISGTAIGLLRHNDEVAWIRNIEISTGGIKFIMVVIGYYLGLSLGYFVISYALAEIFKFISTNIIGYLVSYRRKYKNISLKRGYIKFNEFKEVLRFGVSMHFIDLLGTARREFDLVVIGAMLSPQSVGYYKVIKQFSKMFTLLGNPLKQAVYPDICKLWADNKIKLFIKTQLQLIGILLIVFSVIAVTFWFVSDTVVQLLFGEEYISIVGPLKLYICFSAIFISFQILNSAVLAKGMGGKALTVEVITNIVYFLLIFLLIPIYQLYGIIYALAVSILVWILMYSYYSFFDFKRRNFIHA